MLSSTLPFRFDTPREGQEQLIRDAHTAFRERKIFLAHAETGLGKTDASLSAALEVALTSDPRKTILFLTPKNSQHAIAVEALRGIKEKYSLDLRVIDLVGKKHVCVEESVMHKEGRAFYEACAKKKEMEGCGFFANARGYNPLQREKAGLYRKAFQEQVQGVHAAMAIKEAAATFSVNGNACGLCPYEMSMDLAKRADVIIADYYHVFSPGVAELVLPKLGKKPDNCILIVDEAHNLPERVRNLLSATLTTRQVQKAKEEALFLGKDDLASRLQAIDDALMARGNGIEAPEALVNDQFFSSIFPGEDLNMFSLECEAGGADYLEKSGRENAALIQVGEFMERWAAPSEGNARILKRRGSTDVSLAVKALDPKPLTQPVLEKMHACMLMSGTLHPLDMYADLLGISPQRLATGFYPSPFPKENRLSLIAPIGTTKYTARSEEAFEHMAARLGSIVNAIPGNTVVFFPSFKLLENMGNKLRDYTPRVLLFQHENMKVHQTNELVKKFRQYAHGFGGVLLACANGSLAEGMDFPGNELLGVVIVGIPLAEMNMETRALVDYYEKKFHRGWHYGYIFPAMGKAVQAAGRVIRSPTDKGVIVYLDTRYLQENYKTCLPPTQTYEVTKYPEERVKGFWKD